VIENYNKLLGDLEEDQSNADELHPLPQNFQVVNKKKLFFNFLDEE